VKENSSTDAVVCSTDFMPFFCDILRRKAPENIDGRSFLGPLKDGTQLPERTLYWHYPHYHAGTGMRPAGALRQGSWKLVEWYERSIYDSVNAFELYNLYNDLGEQVNLSDSLPEVTSALASKLSQWRKSVDAQMPVRNDAYVKAE
jgi:arylsulfatase A